MYSVVFSLAGLDSGIRDSGVLVADTLNGEPIPDKLGPLRLIAPHGQAPRPLGPHAPLNHRRETLEIVLRFRSSAPVYRRAANLQKEVHANNEVVLSPNRFVGPEVSIP